MKVSVIMNCHNTQDFLAEAIDSVYAQTFQDWELIFWDNASTDKSAQIAKKYDHRLKYFRENKKTSLGQARNSAVKNCTGDYVTFLDCDDKWLPGKLKTQVTMMENCPSAGLLYSNYFINKANRRILAFTCKQPEGDVFENFLYRYPVAILTVMLRRTNIDRLDGLFDPALNLIEDFDFFLRVLYSSQALYQDAPTAVYRVHPGMTSIKQIYDWRREMELVNEKFSALCPDFNKRFSFALEKRRKVLRYFYAKIYMIQGDRRAAREQIAPVKFTEINYFTLYIFSFLPNIFWKAVNRFLIRNPF